MSPPIAESRPITSLRAIPRSCPRVRNCSFSGSRLAAQGRKVSDAMRSDFNGIVIEIGNAPRKPIQPAIVGKAGSTLVDVNRADQPLLKVYG